jgi:hypothetical protein
MFLLALLKWVKSRRRQYNQPDPFSIHVYMYTPGLLIKLESIQVVADSCSRGNICLRRHSCLFQLVHTTSFNEPALIDSDISCCPRDTAMSLAVENPGKL